MGQHMCVQREEVTNYHQNSYRKRFISKTPKNINENLVYKGWDICIVHDKLVNAQTDSIVVLQDNYMQFQGREKNEILQKGGRELVMEIRDILSKKRSLGQGQILYTHGGNLDQDFLLHINLPDLESRKLKPMVYQYVIELLKTGFSELDLNSITFPLLCNEALSSEIDLNYYACIMLKAAQDFIDTQSIYGNYKIKTARQSQVEQSEQEMQQPVRKQICFISSNQKIYETLLLSLSDVFRLNAPVNLKKSILKLQNGNKRKTQSKASNKMSYDNESTRCPDNSLLYQQQQSKLKGYDNFSKSNSSQLPKHNPSSTNTMSTEQSNQNNSLLLYNQDSNNQTNQEQDDEHFSKNQYKSDSVKSDRLSDSSDYQTFNEIFNKENQIPTAIKLLKEYQLELENERGYSISLIKNSF